MKQIGECEWEISEEDIAAAKLKAETRFQLWFDNDPDCSQILQFVPIKRELIELFKYWYTQSIEHELNTYVLYMSTREHFVGWLSQIRRNQIIRLLAEDEIERAVAEVEEHFRKGAVGFTHQED